ncbi:MAG: 30S ribosomal protein S13 [Candidatus Micrarchaeota archaeon]|nr:30S ribosomal protein S13 [Candidatus Micrarchaeota archaeon]
MPEDFKKAEKYEEKKKDRSAPAQRKPPQQAGKPIISPSGKEVRGVVRLAGKDLRGTLPINRAIVAVKGVGINLGTVLSSIAIEKLQVNDKTLLGELSEEQIHQLEHILAHPKEYGVPSWMLNRQKDLLSGEDLHLIGSDLTFAVKQDIEHEKEINSWRGFRHAYGQKVRGQHTRSTGRTGMTVGVLRKSVLAKAGAAAQATGAKAQQASAAAAKPSAAPQKKEEAKK